MHPRATTIETVDADEIKLAEIPKHPFGIILLYIQASIGMAVAIGLAYFLLPVVITDTDTAFFYGSIFAAVSVGLAFLVVLIATIIYRQNRLIITDRNITQILQYGLFNRKVSQLNINNVEDVTATQNGLLPTILNYGTLKIETAGEQMNFNYTFCPNAGYYAKIILDAREKMLGQMDHSIPTNGQPVPQPTPEPSITQTTSDIDLQKSAAESIKDLGAETIRHARSINQ